MSNSKKLSIIIISYNSKKNLKQCINSVYAKFGDGFSWEIVVVNNDERENLSDLKIDFSRVKLIDHKKNVGFGAGMNLGVKNSEGEFLLLLNPDTEIATDNIKEILTEFSKEDIGIIGGGIISRNGENQEWSAGREISFYDLVRNNLGMSRSKKIWNSSEKIECDWVAGTALFIKRELFDKLEGFDDRFFMYFEDMDLCRRTRKTGLKVLFYPEFKVFHGSGESYEDERLQKKHYYDSMEKFLLKHSKYLSFLIAKIVRKFFIKELFKSSIDKKYKK